MIICKNCNRENEDEYKFCLGCGSSLPKPKPAEPESSGPKMLHCLECGTPVPENFKFCGACGAAIKQASEPEPEPEPATAPHSVTGGEESGELAGRLIVIRADGSEGSEIPLPSGVHTIGRDSERKALANDPFLSPSHATFEPREKGFSVSDEHSLNGVFIRIEGKVELSHGDLVRMGQELLLFELMSEVKPVLKRSEPKIDLAGSPGEHFWGRLSLIVGPDLVSRAFGIGDDGVIIGRETGDIIFRDDGFVSGRHARVGLENGKPILEDLGSSNGTFRRIRSETHIDDGDLLLMGQQLFRLVVV